MASPPEKWSQSLSIYHKKGWGGLRPTLTFGTGSASIACVAGLARGSERRVVPRASSGGAPGGAGKSGEGAAILGEDAAQSHLGGR